MWPQDQQLIFNCWSIHLTIIQKIPECCYWDTSQFFWGSKGQKSCTFRSGMVYHSWNMSLFWYGMPTCHYTINSNRIFLRFQLHGQIRSYRSMQCNTKCLFIYEFIFSHFKIFVHKLIFMSKPYAQHFKSSPHLYKVNFFLVWCSNWALVFSKIAGQPALCLVFILKW